MREENLKRTKRKHGIAMFALCMVADGRIQSIMTHPKSEPMEDKISGCRNEVEHATLAQRKGLEFSASFSMFSVLACMHMHYLSILFSSHPVAG